MEQTTVSARLPADLRAELDTALALPIGSATDDAAFDALARRVFAWQFEHNAPFAAWCRRRGRTPARITHWTEIPAVPTAAFREVALVAGDPASADAIFRTSGTTRGTERRGTHYVLDVSLYDQSLLPQFAAMVLPDGIRPLMLSLVPAPRDLPDSSLAHMIAVVIERLGAEGSGWFATVADGLQLDRLDDALRTAIHESRPVCLLATSFSFVHWLDALAASDTRYTLPDGSRLMDTGGFKGRSREVGEAELRAAYAERFAIPASHCVNEYGMTELCSQFYDASLFDLVRHGTLGPARKLGPPWTRTRIVDFETLEPVPDGSEGLLQHFDLANANSVIAVQTEDIGVRVADGFRLLGRASGATPRGCSIAMDELLAAVRGHQP